MTMAVRDFQEEGVSKSHTESLSAHEAISGLHGLPPNSYANRMKEKTC